MSSSTADMPTLVDSSNLPGRPHQPARSRVPLLVGLAALAVLAALPFVNLVVPVLMPGPFSSSGSLLILAVSLVFGGLAISYDVIFGYTGLLSAGHGLVFALGLYATDLFMIELKVGYFLAALLGVTVATTAAALLGAVALRARAIAFTMVTLAFAEAFFVLLLTDPLGISGGDEGLALAFDQVPKLLVSARDVRWLYWLALAFLVGVYLLARLATRSRAGRVWQAIRENEDRVELLGLVPFIFKLSAFVFGGALAAVGGAVYLLVVRGANPTSASVHFSLALIVMVVLGGTGRLWGAALGGIVYGLLTLRLPALSSSGVLDSFPAWAAGVLAEPLFVLGALFVVIVLFAPGGIAGVADWLAARLRRRWRSHMEPSES